MSRHRTRSGLLSVVAMLMAVQTIGLGPAEARGATAWDVPEMRHLRDVWCFDDGSCLGVGFTFGGAGAVVVLSASGALGPVRPVPGTYDMRSIACPAGSGCVAVGMSVDGPVVVEVSRNGIPGATRPVSGLSELFEVACPTATTCLATGGLNVETFPGHSESFARYVVITDGQPAPAQTFSRGSRPFFGIACPTSTRCLAVGNGDVAIIVRSRSGGWSARVSPMGEPDDPGFPDDDISCPSSTACYTTAFTSILTPEGVRTVPAIMPLSPDGVAGPVQALTTRPGTLYDISCVAVDTCTVVGLDVPTTGGVSIDVARGGPTGITLWANSNYFTGVSCVTAASCGIVGAMPQIGVFGWKGPVPD